MRLKSLLICGGSFFVSLALIIGIAETGSHSPDAIALESGQPQTMLTAWSTASFPVENFQAYTSPFGYRNSPYGGGRQFHYGLDLAAPSGSYIRNWWAGEVVEVSDNTACGTSVVIQSGDWRHIYCHMQGRVVTQGGRRTVLDRQGGIQISVGQQVASGTRIGRVGMTGRTTGPHLHWALKYRGSWVDPALVLRAMYNNQAALSP